MDFGGGAPTAAKEERVDMYDTYCFCLVLEIESCGHDRCIVQENTTDSCYSVEYAVGGWGIDA